MTEPKRIRIGNWTATPSLNLLESDGRSVRIEPRAMDVLVLLAGRAGEVISTRELLASVWTGIVVGDGSVYLAINQLRSVLDAPGADASHIETVPKRGYRLVVPVAPATGDFAAADERRGINSPPASLSRRRARLGGVVLAGCVLASLLAFAVLRGVDRGVAPASVAVLPFDNLSADPEQEYFADGLTQELLNALSRIPDLHVAGRTSSFWFKGRAERPRTIGQLLGVTYLLDGSVRKEGGNVRVAAQLMDARTGFEVWSGTYERPLAGVFVVQDEIAKAVADALQITLSVGDLVRVPGMTRNARAYDEYLRGLALNIEMRAESFPAAFHHLERAVAIDPSFSVAWAALHTVYENGALVVPERAAEWRRKGAEALARARALTPNAPEVLFETGMAELRVGNWRGAGDAFAALETAHARYGMADRAWGPRGAFLLAVGRVGEAVEALERAKAVEPLEVAYAYFLGSAYIAAGELEAARREMERGLRLHGLRGALDELGLAIALSTLHEDELDRRLSALVHGGLPAGIARTLMSGSTQSKMESGIRHLAGDADAKTVSILAQWAAAHGEPGLALELLAQALPDLGHPDVLWRPYLRDARRLPAFRELVSDAGFVEYWRAHGWPDWCRPLGDDFGCE